MSAATLFLLQVIVIVITPLILSQVFRSSSYLPLVVVQILTGIALGPSLFGAVAPEAFDVLFSAERLTPLQHIGSLALLLFAFTTGLHLRSTELSRNPALWSISAASLLVPGLLGVLAGYWIMRNFPETAGPSATATQFALGVGICTAVTALPVLAALLRESGLIATRIGQQALTIAAINDAALWIMLSGVMALRGLQHPSALSLPAVGAALAFAVVMFTLVKHPIKWLQGQEDFGRFREGLLLPFACATAVISGLLFELAGLHFVLGAFVAGAAMPLEVRRRLLERIEPLTATLLMPFFFMCTGLRTLIDTHSTAFVTVFVLLSLVASLGKFVGVSALSRVAGERWRNAMALGALTQTKGLMEIVVVTALLDIGVFSRVIFSSIVLMALLSTCVAMPLASALLGRRSLEHMRNEATAHQH